MKVSTRSRYGLRMLIELGRRPKAQVIPLRVISDKLGVSKKYLERIARMLENGGYVTGEKGVKGGYKLAKPPAKIRISNVLSVLEGDIVLSECLNSNCVRQDNCLASRFWVKLARNIKEYLDRLTLVDLLGEQDDLSRL